MADPRREPLRARRNTPFYHVFSVTDAAGAPLAMTGYSAAMQVRLYGMQPGGPLLDLLTVDTELTHGLTLSGSDVTAYGERLELAFLPAAPIAGRDVRFHYDLTLTAPDGFSWVEKWGAFDLADGVTGDSETFLTTDTGAILMTADGKYLEAV
jgi:hypothetical protein